MNTQEPYSWPVIILAIFTLVGSAYGAYEYRLVSDDLVHTRFELASTTKTFALQYDALTKEKATLLEELAAERQKIALFEGQIGQIANTVGTLEKLKKTDQELLQKYSKVFFLNEHYVPPRLTTIDPAYTVDKTKPFEIHADVWPHLQGLLARAAGDKVELRVASSFRSFGTQAQLKSRYVTTYGSGSANKFSADQGYSEHQLGTTVDFSTASLGSNFSSFDATAAYVWLTEHAHEYGFVLSYPKNNKYYQYEPWHWRYVGVDLARKLHEDKKYFYDLDQREIDTYLVKIFD